MQPPSPQDSRSPRPHPLILVSPHTEQQSGEFPDAAISLSRRYSDALLDAGGLPLVLPTTLDPARIRAAVAATDGVLLTGGDDVAPRHHAPHLPDEVLATVYPSVGDRDLFEFILVDEVFRQGKPLFAICRGHQVVNVVLGGSLVADLPLQRPDSLDGGRGHNQCDRRFEPVHDVLVEPGSLLAELTSSLAFGVNSTHHQAIDRVAPPLRATGRAPDGIIEALELDPASGVRLPFFLTVQFHPERLHDRLPEHARLFTGFIEACRQGSG